MRILEFTLWFIGAFISVAMITVSAIIAANRDFKYQHKKKNKKYEQ